MKFTERPRRLRRTPFIRDLVQENHLSSSDLVWPLFIKEGSQVREPIAALPGCARLSPDLCIEEIKALLPFGLKAIELFPAIDEKLKNTKASESLNPHGLVPKTIQQIKNSFPDLVVISDIALDPYSSDGHDGLVRNGEVLNDETVVVLAEQAKVHAAAGADFVAPRT